MDQFTAYLKWANEEDLDFFEYDPEKLDQYLTTFWFNIRTSSGEFYKIKSLEAIRYSLNRALKDSGCKFDITSKSGPFQNSIKAFEDAKRELKKKGKGNIDHIPDINPTGQF